MLSYRPLQRWDGRNAALRVETVDMVQDNNRVTVRVIGGELPKGTRINLWLSGTELYPKPYDILEGEFSLSTPNKNIRSYFKADGIYLNGYAAGYGENEIKHIKPDVRPFMYHIIEARRSARNTIMSQKNMDGTSGLIAGIAFGFKQDIFPTSNTISEPSGYPTCWRSRDCMLRCCRALLWFYAFFAFRAGCLWEFRPQAFCFSWL